jgi:hypothetical protein
VTNEQRTPERANAQTLQPVPSRAAGEVPAFPRARVSAERHQGERAIRPPSLRRCVLWFLLAVLTSIALGVP